MDIILANFQIKAIADLTVAMEQPNRDIILKSCTGSGKTIILTHFMDEYLKAIIRRCLFGLLLARATLKNKAKKKWSGISMEARQNCCLIL